MGSKQKTSGQMHQTTNQTQEQSVTGIEPYQKQFANQYNTLSDLFNSRVNAPLNLDKAGTSATLDPLVSNMVSQGIENIKANESANQRDTASRLSVLGTGDNSALLAALNRNAGYGTAGALNSLVPMGLQGQQNQDLLKAQLIAQNNAATLAGRQQGISELTPGMNLLQMINQMAQTSAGKKMTSTSDTKGSENTTMKKGFFI